MPAATARSSTACEVASSEPALCMNDFSSASPKVIAPMHRLETFTPEEPRFLYFILVTSRRTVTPRCAGRGDWGLVSSPATRNHVTTAGVAEARVVQRAAAWDAAVLRS